MIMIRRKNKPNIVLVHGWGMHSAFWTSIRPWLDEHCRVTCLELPQHGNNIEATLPESLQTWIEALRTDTRLPTNAIWLGWSLGGTVAMAMAAFAPEKVARLITVGTSPRFEKSAGWCGVNSEVLDSFEKLLARNASKALQRLLTLQTQDMEKNTAQRTQNQLQRLLNERPQATPKALAQGLHWLRTTDLRSHLTEITQPTLLLAGEKDYFVSNKALQCTQNNLLNGRVGLIEGAGHAPFVSHPQAFTQQLTCFMNEHG